jgi:hypothetical protein
MVRVQSERSYAATRSVAPRLESRKRSSRVSQETESKLGNQTSEAEASSKKVSPTKQLRNHRSLDVGLETMPQRQLRSSKRNNNRAFRSLPTPESPCQPSSSRAPLSVENVVAHDVGHPSGSIRSTTPTEEDTSPEFLALQASSSSKPLVRVDHYPLTDGLLKAHDEKLPTHFIAPTTPTSLSRESTINPSRPDIIVRDFAYTPEAEAARKRSRAKIEREALALLQEVEAPPSASSRSKGKGRATLPEYRDFLDCYLHSGLTRREMQEELRQANAAHVLADISLGSLQAAKQKVDEFRASVELKRKVSGWKQQVKAESTPSLTTAPATSDRVLRPRTRATKPLPRRGRSRK